MTGRPPREYDAARLDASTEFSPSKLDTFKDCPRRYHYRYIDRIPSDKRFVEAVMGTCAHAGLEAVYRGLLRGRVPALEEALAACDEAWEREAAKGPITAREGGGTLDDWRGLGRECVRTYYEAHKPFDEDRTVAVEPRVSFPLQVAEPETGSLAAFQITGYVDRLAVDPKDGWFVIHDFKTSKTLPPEASLAEDWQLPLYNAAVLHAWPNAPGARLRWHFLRFGHAVTQLRTHADLALLKGRVAERIRNIKRERAFEPIKSALCGWCEYREICPVWKHAEAYARLPADERLHESGVRLADRYAELEARRKALKEQLAEVERDLEAAAGEVLRYADSHDVRGLAGTDAELDIRSREEVRFPTRTNEPEQLGEIESRLKGTPVWEEVSRLDPKALMDGFRDRRWPLGVMEAVEGWLGRLIRKEIVRVIRVHRREEPGD